MLDIHFPFLHNHPDAKPEPRPTPAQTPEPEPEEVATMVTTAAVPAPHESLGQKIVDVEKKFISILDFVGKEAEKGLVFAVKYAIPLDNFIGFLIPGLKPEADAGVVVLNLIQSAVLEVKAKSAALPANLTPTQMLADELALVGPAVILILKKEGVSWNSDQTENVIKAVVAILNTQPPPAS